MELLRKDLAGLRPATTTSAPTSASTHRVGRGETLWSIARRWGVTVADLKRVNGLTGDAIYVGQKLLIPAPGASGGVPAEGAQEGSLTWPVPGLSQARSEGEALVIYAPEGTSVVAAATGRVSYVSERVRGLGAVVMVEHRGGLLTLYGQLGEVAVAVGDRVRRGEPIGRVGAAGVGGPRLRFMVFKDSRPVPARDHVAP